MRLYEYEAKFLLRRYKIPTPEGLLYRGGADFEQITFPCVLKAQTFVGGRGKSGAIRFAVDKKEAQQAVDELKKLVVSGYPVEKVLLEHKISIGKEFYVAVAVDRVRHTPVLIASPEGGVEIEDVARQKPESVFTFPLEPGGRVEPYLGRKVGARFGLSGEMLTECGEIVHRMMDLFFEYDCKLVEVNPLVAAQDGRMVALDAKIDLDDDALFRHPQLREWGIELRHEIGEFTKREKKARAGGVAYVDLDGDIGCFPGGAGFGIAAIDLIAHYGGRAANFMDSGGAPTQEGLKLMLELLVGNPKVTVIFGARFGGISRCDDWARAVVQYVVENRPTKPMIMRMAGNMEEEGRRVIESAVVEHPELFKGIKIYRYDTPIEEVIQEAVRIARDCRQAACSAQD